MIAADHPIATVGTGVFPNHDDGTAATTSPVYRETCGLRIFIRHSVPVFNVPPKKKPAPPFELVHRELADLPLRTTKHEPRNTAAMQFQRTQGVISRR